MGKELTQWIACRVIRSQGLILRTAASGYTLVSNDAVVAATQSEFGKALCNKSQNYKNKSKKYIQSTGSKFQDKDTLYSAYTVRLEYFCLTK